MPSPLTPGFQSSLTSSSKALPPIPRKGSALYYTPHSAPISRKASSTFSIPTPERPDTPMTSGKSSTTYFNLKDERPRTPRSALQDEVIASNAWLVPPETRSSTSKIADKVAPRPQLKREARTHEASDLAAPKQSLGNLVSSQWKAPKYEYSDDEYGSSLPTSRKASSHGSWAPSEHTQSAEERARDYTSVLPVLVSEPSYSESGNLSSEMSARITDVFDGSLTPLPLALSGNSEDRKLSSQFSDSDSEVESLLGESKPSLRSRAKKAFNPRKVSQERKEKAPAGLRLSQHSELTASNRNSLQNGTDDMYTTLTGLYSPSKPKTKHNSATAKSSPRRPTTPLTADGKPGKKGWEVLKSQQSPALRKDDSVGKKLASVLQNGALAVGLDRGRERKMKNEE